MVQQDTSKLKENIALIIKRRGPSLPAHISKETGLSILFSGAFLSELLSDKIIRISHMRVGSSPIYYIPGQEHMLERYYIHLNTKEKEAFELLKEKKFIQDSSQQPAIRVALRSIKDFAIPFKKGETIFWRYFKTPLSEFKPSETEKSIVKLDIEPVKPVRIEKPETKQKELEIFDKPKKEFKKTPRKKSDKTNEKFFNKIKEHLAKKGIDMIDIESFSKNDIILKIKEKGQEKLLVAYNKKRITESDIINAHKKAYELKTDYIIVSFGETSKKLQIFIDAVKNLSRIEKI